jgi:hypothetical protein
MTSSDVDARERARLLREASCLKCAHMPVCIVLRELRNYLLRAPEDDADRHVGALEA